MTKSRLYQIWTSETEWTIVRAHSRAEARAIFIRDTDGEIQITRIREVK